MEGFIDHLGCLIQFLQLNIKFYIRRFRLYKDFTYYFEYSYRVNESIMTSKLKSIDDC